MKKMHKKTTVQNHIFTSGEIKLAFKLEKKYALTLDNYGQSCFAKRDF
jgi:hypothetical protein